jgi:AAA15 family ATPase/GTPase
MILEFKTKNYKSFAEEIVFSMTAAPKQKGLDYSLLKSKIRSKYLKGLCSSVIYGPNASGKTNIIGAMDTFRAIVLRGNIKNSEDKVSPNRAAYSLELIPNNSAECSEPVLFSIDFIELDILIHYEISLDLGCFLDNEYHRKIIKEELSVNNELIFSRGDELTFGENKSIKKYQREFASIEQTRLKEILGNSLNDEDLFLANGFKLLFDPILFKLITNWFENQFMIIYRADSVQLIKRFDASKKQAIYIEDTINKAAKLFGVNANDLGYVRNKDESDARLCSVFNNKKSARRVWMDAEEFESYGTVRFVNMFPLVISAIMSGGTLVVDEFDASIHPMALMSIINIFHNDNINLKKAQLIFNTHNPIFLNSNLFRRDEIKFVERNDKTNSSIIYALSDFGTSGNKGVRKHEDYLKNYFVSQYGAIKDVDFTPIFTDLISKDGEALE